MLADELFVISEFRFLIFDLLFNFLVLLVLLVLLLVVYGDADVMLVFRRERRSARLAAL